MAADISMFDTRTMLTALTQAKPASTFLLDTFFPNSITHTSENIDIDIVDKTGRKLAPFVSPRLEGKVIKKKGFKTRTYKAPYIKEKTITTALDILQREPGTTIYAPGDSPAMRAARELGKDLADLRDLIMRRMEWMAAQLLTTGAMAIVGDGIDDFIDFGMKNTHLEVLSGAALWTAVAPGSNPIKDLERWAELQGQDSGIYPDVCIMGQAAWDAFRIHQTVKDMLWNRRIEIGSMAPKLVAPGVHYVMRLDSAGLDIYTYAESYYDDTTSALVNFIPTKNVIIGSTSAYTRQHFGAIKDLSATAVVPMFPKTWIEEDPSAQMLLLQSAPLVALHQVDAFGCYQPVA